MKASRLLLLSVLAFALTPISAQTISAADAKNHVGEKATVCGKVAGERDRSKQPWRADFHQFGRCLSASGFHHSCLGRRPAKGRGSADRGSACLRHGSDSGLQGSTRDCGTEQWAVEPVTFYLATIRNCIVGDSDSYDLEDIPAQGRVLWNEAQINRKRARREPLPLN